MIYHRDVGKEDLQNFIKQGDVVLAGNCRLKIYGLLTCNSGKRMKKENRVFFKSKTGAIQLGFRPCGHCLPGRYARWKSNS